MALQVQHLLHQVGDRRLAGARQAGEPQHAGFLGIERRARLPVDPERPPMDVAGAAQRERDHAARHRGVALAVDQDEAAHLAVVA